MGLVPPSLTWICIDAPDIFYLSGVHGSVRSSSSSAQSLREALNVSPTTSILGYLNASDSELEGLYSMGPELTRALQQLPLKVVGAPSYSSFVYRPRIDQVFNLRRMFTVFSEMAEAEIPAFPTVFHAREADVVGWRDWLLKNEQVWLIGTIVQRQPTAFFEDQIRQLVRVQSELERGGRSLHVVLYGVGSPLRARRARELGLRRFACVSSMAAMTAGHGQKLDVSAGKLRQHRASKKLSRDELFAMNLSLQAELFSQIELDADGWISSPQTLWALPT